MIEKDLFVSRICQLFVYFADLLPSPPYNTFLWQVSILPDSRVVISHVEIVLERTIKRNLAYQEVVRIRMLAADHTGLLNTYQPLRDGHIRVHCL